ncbi:MAG: hypothetical protein R3F14_36885, partial [Polyangiaceae bacterium]
MKDRDADRSEAEPRADDSSSIDPIDERIAAALHDIAPDKLAELDAADDLAHRALLSTSADRIDVPAPEPAPARDTAASTSTPPPPATTSAHVDRGPAVLTSRTALAMLTAAVLVAVPYAVPQLGRLRLLTPLSESASLFGSPAPAQPAATVGEAELKIETKDDDALSQPEVVELPAAAREIVPPPNAEQKPPRSIEDPTEHALDPFFRKLMAVE